MLEYRRYIEASERLLSLGKKTNQENMAFWYYVPAVVLAWSAIESFVNSRLGDLSKIPGDAISLHEKSFLEEKNIL